MRDYDILGFDARDHLFDMWIVWDVLGDPIARRAWLGQSFFGYQTHIRFI